MKYTPFEIFVEVPRQCVGDSLVPSLSLFLCSLSISNTTKYSDDGRRRTDDGRRAMTKAHLASGIMDPPLI